MNYILIGGLISIIFAAIALEALSLFRKKNPFFRLNHNFEKIIFLVFGFALGGAILSLVVQHDIHGLFLTASTLNSKNINEEPLLDSQLGQPNEIILEPEFLMEKIYENEVFGSTINKLLFHKRFLFDESYHNTSNALLKFDPKSDDNYKSLFLPASTTSNILYKSPENQFNQVPGNYKVRLIFRITPFDNLPTPKRSGSLGTIILNARGSAEKNFRLEFDGRLDTDQVQTFSFDYKQMVLGGASTFEVWSDGVVPIWLKEVVVEKVEGVDFDQQIPDVFPDVSDWDASEGSSRLGDPVKHLAGTMAFGPYDAAVPSGNYKAIFRVKVADNKIANNVIRLETASLKNQAYSQQTHFLDIKGLDFNQSLQYQYFELPVTKTDEDFLEYRVYFYDTAKVWFDHVMLVPMKKPNPQKPSTQTLKQKSFRALEAGRKSLRKGFQTVDNSQLIKQLESKILHDEVGVDEGQVRDQERKQLLVEESNLSVPAPTDLEIKKLELEIQKLNLMIQKKNLETPK